MKRNNTKKSMNKFVGRNTHKRRSKERAKAELLRAVNEVGVGTDALKLNMISDDGPRARVGTSKRRDEEISRGVFSSSKSGFGFVKIDELTRDVFIPEDKTAGAIEGDLVEIVYHIYKSRFGEEKTEGRVRKIIEYGMKTMIGTLEYESFFARGEKRARNIILVPDDRSVSVTPIVTDVGGASIGDKVEILLKRSHDRYIEGSVIRSFGDANSKEANYEAILTEYGIETEFSDEELKEADEASLSSISEEGRTRFTRDAVFTIDGEGAKDLDDAVSVRRLSSGGWQLGVHIADVSYYVKERTHLDRAVMRRGTSVYFTDKVVPMLPPALSNGVCSLNAGEDKYAISAIINITKNGEIASIKIFPSIIQSKLRGVYSEVNRIFEGNADREVLEKYSAVTPSLLKMHELYHVLKSKSERRGYIELDTAEAEILLSDFGEPIDIVKRRRGDAEKMIEQFMLCANEAVATFLTERGIPCVYRIHEPPPKEKLDDFVIFMQNLGFKTQKISKENPEPYAFRELICEAEERGISAPVSYFMLRSMSKAKYCEQMGSHFGLGISTYCHFTSPIRRLSDLATHRIIRRVLFEEKRAELYNGYAKRAAAAATEGELRAVGAERRIEELYKVIYMEKHIGEDFDAAVSSVTSFGVFCMLDNTCEGLIPISSLPGVFTYDEKNAMMRSRDFEIRIGDAVRVRLVEADVIRGKLRFSLV